MKAKKLLSMILTLCIIFTTIGSITVVNAADEVVVNVAQGAPCTLADGTVVDTSYPGYQIINGVDGKTYRVNVGTYGIIMYDDMEGHSTTINPDGVTGTTTVNNSTVIGATVGKENYDVTYNAQTGVQTEKGGRYVKEDENTALALGPIRNGWAYKWTLDNPIAPPYRVSMDVQVTTADFSSLTNGNKSPMALQLNGGGIMALYVEKAATNAKLKARLYSVTEKGTSDSNYGGYVYFREESALENNIWKSDWITLTIEVYEDGKYNFEINGVPFTEDMKESGWKDENITQHSSKLNLSTIAFGCRTAGTNSTVKIDNLKVTDCDPIYPSEIKGDNLTDSVYSGVKNGKVSVPVTMNNGTTQNFTANYTLTDAQTSVAGTYNVEATIPGFSEKVNVAVTVNATAAADKTVNTHQNAVYAFPTSFDSMAVTWKNYDGSTVTAADTSVIGRKYYTGTIADGRTVTYTVNTGSYDSGIADSMENHTVSSCKVTVNESEIELPWFTPSTPSGLNVALVKPDAVNRGYITTKTETVNGVDNQYLTIGPDYTFSSFAKWNIIDSGFDNGFHISYKLKIDSITKFPTTKNAIVKVAMDGNNGEIGNMVIQLGTSATDKNNHLFRVYHGSTGKAYTSVNSLINSRMEGDTTVYYTDWMQIDVYGYNDGYDVALNGTKFADRIPYSGNGAGELVDVRIEKRDLITKNQYGSMSDAVSGFDDLTIRRFKCFTGDLPSPLNLTVPVGAESTDIDLVLGNGDLQKFNVNFDANADKIANLSNVDATIAGFDGTVKANVKVCNYDIDGVNIKNGSEFVTAPVAGGEVVSAKITRLTDAAASQAIFVLYSQNDEIKAIKTADISGLAKDTETVIPVGMTLPENTAAGDYIRVYVWDSKTNIQPLDMVTDISFNYGVAPAVYFAGDSTACNYSYTDAVTQWPKTGIGQVFSDYYAGNITNLAKSGATTKSFINDGLWERIITNVNTGDYVVISFGHNDQDYCLTEPCFFEENLQRFINEARAEGANVLMYSPITRRGQEGNANRFEPGGDHKTHMADLEKICTDNNVPFIDMEEKSVTYLKGMTSDESAKLYMIDLANNGSSYSSHALWATSRYNPAVKNDVAGYSNDNTHFNLYGAKVYAQMLANAIKEQYPSIQLSNYLTKLNETLTYPALD